jgi:hypothetical protein
MTYTPKAGSRVAQAVQYIASQHQGATSEQIAEATGIPLRDLHSTLEAPVRNGLLVACKITKPGRPAMNHFRMAAGGQPKSEFADLKKSPTAVRRQPQAQVGKNSVSEARETSWNRPFPGASPSQREAPGGDQKGRESGPAADHHQASDVALSDDIGLMIDSNGQLSILF